MVLRIIRKMINKKIMTFCLFIGILLAVSILSSIPVYTDGILQRMLTKDLEEFQIKNNYFTGAYYLEAGFEGENKDKVMNRFSKLNDAIQKNYYPNLKIPALSSYVNLDANYFTMRDILENNFDVNISSVGMQAFTNIKDHIKIITGKMPSDKKNGDIYEVMVRESTMKKMNLTFDKLYYLSDPTDDKFISTKIIKVKIVGIYDFKDSSDPYWSKVLKDNNTDFSVMDYNLFLNEFSKEEIANIYKISWFYALDYHKISVSNLGFFLNNIKQQVKGLYNSDNYASVFPAFKIIDQYTSRAQQLKTTLLVLQIPVLLLIAFYIFMVSQLIVNQEKNEIAVLRSRGASRGQILKEYFVEGVLISGLALIIGPLIGLFLCTILGSSNGFLEFVQRKRLPVSLNLKAYLYSLIGIIVFLITMILPVIFSTKVTIVQFKQNKKNKKSFWERYYLDLILICISFYGVYAYKNRLSITKISGMSGADLPMDLLLFLVSTFFIVGTGMLFLRIFPYIIRLIYWCGKDIWGAVTYVTLIRISRTVRQDQFLILFLIMTLGNGLFNANAARTINNNMEDKIKYMYGADIVLKPEWESNASDFIIPQTPQTPQTSGSEPVSNITISDGAALIKKLRFTEPPFNVFQNIKGVEKAAKVYSKSDISVNISVGKNENSNFMAIDSKDFGETAWLETNMMKYQWNDYLNLLAKEPSAVLLSRSFEKNYKAKVGDIVALKIGDNNYTQFVIYGFIDYWPTYNPSALATNTSISTSTPNESDISKPLKTQQMVVANLQYVEQMTSMEPYDVWLKLKTGATTEDVYNDITTKKIPILSIKNAKQELVANKNDAMLQGTNGALSLGFIVTMVITALGFLIYWVLSIKNRTIQFGIFRALGLSFKQIIAMLMLEQVLISVTAIFIGILIGGITSDIFIPLLQMSNSATEQIIPYRIVEFRGDYIKIYIIIGVVLVSGFIILGRLISSIKISQALKLGED